METPPDKGAETGLGVIVRLSGRVTEHRRHGVTIGAEEERNDDRYMGGWRQASEAAKMDRRRRERSGR